jgi:hypothetical protein
MTHLHRILTAFAITFALAAPALAGPPLLCHPFDIGAAQSLPWDGTRGWSHGRSDYAVANLVADTQRIVQPDTPVVVRMETVRRAAIYASQDPAVTTALLDALGSPARAARDPLAPLDVAYAIEALHQITMLGPRSEFAGRVAGINSVLAGRNTAPFIEAATKARPSDPAVSFAAAMILMGTDKDAYRVHAARARAGASQDALVSKNLDHLPSL